MFERLIDATIQPTDAEMLNAIGPDLAPAWSNLRRFLVETYAITPLLQYGGKRYGWNLQHRLGSRPLCEMYPEHGSFTALVVLGKAELQQALDKLESFGPHIQQALLGTPRFHDGCWLYLRVSEPGASQQDVQDIGQLVLLKKKPPKKKAAAG